MTMKRPLSPAHVPQSLALVPLAPVLAVQAWRTVRRTPRLDPASGAERGLVPGPRHGAAPAYRLVVVGESTAVGVGAAEHARALPGFLAEALAARLRCAVTWTVAGENGATARRVARLARGRAGGHGHADLVVATVGINDLIRRRALDRWADDVADLVAVLRGGFGDASVLVAGMPPVHRFPALPRPLRTVLGARARRMDRVTREAAHAAGAVHVPMDEALADDRALFAADGFHPSAAGYRAWANDLARAAVPARGGGDGGTPGTAGPWRANREMPVRRRSAR
ncbi:SGNH/GDSL hydrolase family protein [Actinomadura opuntiae]|uniref:SGNH/GDSL hydrolase family protein n=1 Tax=Actinomadura sp. OS1-43 TaxID=604315 RepID=UPI00255AC7E8|nr:SGNH/GDSL hydrolase family protein [Actinomadura sp. OS1-43]MDL4815589.1 SGNH/GDSL hydrolase family protein [Actinomadura sp. OS1-43]